METCPEIANRLNYMFQKFDVICSFAYYTMELQSCEL